MEFYILLCSLDWEHFSHGAKYSSKHDYLMIVQYCTLRCTTVGECSCFLLEGMM